MSEFQNDAQRDTHVAALAVEHAGYVAREAAYDAVDDKHGVKRMQNRQAQVEAEIDRISGGVDTADGDAKPAAGGRGRKPAAGGRGRKPVETSDDDDDGDAAGGGE